MLLLWPDKKTCFLAGLAGFFAGHVCYIPALLSDATLSPLRAAVAAPVLALLGAAAYLSLQRHLPGEMKLPVSAYLLVILGMAWAVMMTANPLFLAGSASFLFSDYLLARSLFIRRCCWTDGAVLKLKTRSHCQWERVLPVFKKFVRGCKVSRRNPV